MGIKDRLKKWLRPAAEPAAQDDEQIRLLNELFTEAKAATGQSAWYYDITFSKLERYREFKQQPPAWRKVFFFRALDRLANDAYPPEMKRLDETHRSHYYGIRYAHEALYQLLIRSNYPFTEEELFRIFSTYRSNSSRTFPTFSSWPLIGTFRHVERYAKEHGYSDSLLAGLRDMLGWTVLHVDPGRYQPESITKLRSRIELLLEAAIDDGGRPVPFRFPGDRLGERMEQSLSARPQSERDAWHLLLHHCTRASAGKPSNKFQKIARELTDRIGTDAHRSLVRDWIDYVTGLNLLAPDSSKLLKGLIWTLLRYHDRETLAAVARLGERAFRKVPGVGPAAAAPGNACIYVLAHTRGTEGISHLTRLRQRITQTNTRKLIDRYLGEAADRLGISTAALEERVVPDFGLTDGSKETRFGDYTLRTTVTGVAGVEQRWVRPDGKVQRSVPAAVKELATYRDRLKREKSSVARIRKQLTAQRDRIDQLFRADRSRTYADFRRYYLDHGLVGFLARRLIWTIEVGGETVAALYHDGEWRDVNGRILTEPAGETDIILWHPLDATRDGVLAWRDRLQELGIVQPLKQAYREVYLLTDAEIETRTYSNRMAAHLLKQHQFNALARGRGWRYTLLGAFDHGMWDIPATVELPHYGITGELYLDEVNSENDMTEAGMWSYVASDGVKFRRGEADPAMDLVDVPRLVFSEVMRDVDLFVGVSSVGNDPQWRDNGGVRLYRDYWTAYSFGELNEIAKTRRDVLERLLPRLKIAAVARLDGRFLRVRGTLREYKIHLGSTNILMEPNDQYLCIVPDRRSKASGVTNVYLPFEGDRGLSIIISKAFLLADDTGIDDPSIVRQIRQR